MPVGESAGVFLSLDNVKDLFNERFTNDEDTGGRYAHSNSIDKYPVGHLPGIGCIQTRQPLPLLFTTVKRINSEVGVLDVIDDDDSDAGYANVDPEGDGDLQRNQRGTNRCPLYGSHTQVYNLSNHFFAPRANRNRITHGQVTAAVSGFFASTQADKRKGEKASRKVKEYLPYQIFETQMDESRIPKAMRLETVYSLDWQDVKEEYQNGW